MLKSPHLGHLSRMSKNPMLSVIMAVYNCDPFVSESIESILSQTFTDYEFIIVDDSSADDTLNLLTSYAAKDSRIILVKNEINLGLTESLNLAIEMSSGVFIARMDGDDISHPSRLAEQIACLLRNPEIVCVGAQAKIIDEDGDIIEDWTKPLSSEEIKEKLVSEGGGQIIHPLATFRRTAFNQVGGYDSRYRLSQDYDLLLKFAEIGELCNLPQFLLKYRRHKNAITSSKRNAQINYAIKALIEAQERRNLQIDHILIPEVAYPRAEYHYHLNYARKALMGKNYESAKKHARHAKQAIPRYSPEWHEMNCIIKPSFVNRSLCKLSSFFSPKLFFFARCLRSMGIQNSRQLNGSKRYLQASSGGISRHPSFSVTIMGESCLDPLGRTGANVARQQDLPD